MKVSRKNILSLCNNCDGKGQNNYEYRCPECNGSGRIFTRTYTFKYPFNLSSSIVNKINDEIIEFTIDLDKRISSKEFRRDANINEILKEDE